MFVRGRFQYYRRIVSAYLLGRDSHLSFWHEIPQINPGLCVDRLAGYYMTFAQKADYSGARDATGIPMLDYHGAIGLQYNPIAIAQWGLGNHNLYSQSGEVRHKQKFLSASDWLCDRLERNSFGVAVWNHHFDWEYRSRLRAPWYSALAQGQGTSLLVRAHRETGDGRYLEAARSAFDAFTRSVDDGGVTFTDEHGDTWFEEYIVAPPTHILNGFMWAAWGVYDYWLATGDESARSLFTAATRTLLKNLGRYDLGFWSLYEQSGTVLHMIASPFYHRLHIVQLRIMRQLTGEATFADYADKWENYARSSARRTCALFYKGAFKLCYY